MIMGYMRSNITIVCLYFHSKLHNKPLSLSLGLSNMTDYIT